MLSNGWNTFWLTRLASMQWPRPDTPSLPSATSLCILWTTFRPSPRVSWQRLVMWALVVWSPFRRSASMNYRFRQPCPWSSWQLLLPSAPKTTSVRSLSPNFSEYLLSCLNLVISIADPYINVSHVFALLPLLPPPLSAIIVSGQEANNQPAGEARFDRSADRGLHSSRRLGSGFRPSGGERTRLVRKLNAEGDVV